MFLLINKKFTPAKRSQQVAPNNVAMLRWHVAIVWPGLTSRLMCLTDKVDRDWCRKKFLVH